jgi:hypothetical protein
MAWLVKSNKEWLRWLVPAMMLALSILWLYIIVLASTSGWHRTLWFDNYGEGLPEVALISIIVILGVVNQGWMYSDLKKGRNL